MTSLEILLGAGLLTSVVIVLRTRSRAQASEAQRTSLRKVLEALAREKHEVEGSMDRLKREEPELEARTRRKLLTSIVEMDDHVRRAVEHLDEETPDALKQGLELLVRELEKTWLRCGLDPIAPEPGTPFDPKIHEALTAREEPDAEAQTVETLHALGFLDGEHLVRPARVGVVMPPR